MARLGLIVLAATLASCSAAVVDGGLEESTVAALPDEVAPPTPTPRPTRTIRILHREGWGAAPPSAPFVAHRIERITVHHTADVLAENSLAPKRIRSHQRYHQSLGWPDLAYHFVIDLDGNVYEGRPTTARGDTRTSYDPTGHLLITLEGNFEEQEPTVEQLESLVSMLAWGASEYGVDPATIQGHSDVAATACPGRAVRALLSDGTLLARVAALMDLEDVGLLRASPDESREAIDLIRAPDRIE
jgi:hypothetical protein